MKIETTVNAKDANLCHFDPKVDGIGAFAQLLGRLVNYRHPEEQMSLTSLFSTLIFTQCAS